MNSLPQTTDTQIATAVLLLFLIAEGPLLAAPKKVSFSQAQTTIEAYDFIEIVAQVDGPDAANPFLDASLTGSFGTGVGGRTQVEGFCDSLDWALLLQRQR
jgi:hypothetical protein